ncbi:DUF2577 family protein [Lacrimispora celerecrescens]|uniref:DUF2577 family protein n=1 Tax=Lacrimispora celerecrescens TaxID=29354 RepID=UPI0016471BA3|nr:DUF2577 family protein [Lacrimispora celerecrescens]
MIEDLVRIMREEGAKSNPPGIEFAVMTGAKSCRIGDFPLSEEDLIFSEHLLNPIATTVSVNTAHIDQSQYLSPLKSGDDVAIIKVSKTKYLVLDKVVGL